MTAHFRHCVTLSPVPGDSQIYKRLRYHDCASKALPRMAGEGGA